MPPAATTSQQGTKRATCRAPEYNVPPMLMDWPGRPCWFSDQPEKHKLGTGHCNLASCQVSLNSVSRFQRSLFESETEAAILLFRSAQKHKLCEGRRYLASCQVSLTSIQRCQRSIRKCLSLSETGPPFCFSDGPKKH